MQYPFAPFNALKIRLAAFALALGVGCLSPINSAASSTDGSAQGLESFAKTCIAQTQANERDLAIPRGLLSAIALAESGRWNPAGGADGEIIAWPWTVTAKGKGHFFPTREQAVTFVYELMADGIENIDVGCMQVNLMHHAEAFADVQSAFDPALNVAYGAKYLIGQYASAKSWIKAAGNYHSTTEDLNRAYRNKVRKLWRSGTALRTLPRSKPPSAHSPIASATPPGREMATLDAIRTIPETNPETTDATLSPFAVDVFDFDFAEPLAPYANTPAARHIRRLNQWRIKQVQGLRALHARNFKDVITRQASLGLPTLAQPGHLSNF